MARLKAFRHGRVCYHGELRDVTVFVDTESGLIIRDPNDERHSLPYLYSVEDREEMEEINLHNQVLAPAFIELQTNGALGMHFTQFKDEKSYQENLERVSRYLVESGVATFYVTLPTVGSEVFKKELKQTDASLMRVPSQSTIEHIYGDNMDSIKLITLAPELEGSIKLIKDLTETLGIQVSLGHSAADFDTAQVALQAGAKSLTHVFNAMNPLHHRQPGLAGLIISRESPYFSVIADGIHLHPATLAMTYRANPPKCILITDSVEMAGLPDGLYPGHEQIPHQQRKQGNKVTIDGTDTLIGSCCSIDECVRNLMQWSRCSLAQAVRCATENIANMMELGDRGMIDEGRRADFVVLDDTGQVLQTWIGGEQVYSKWTGPSIWPRRGQFLQPYHMLLPDSS